MLFKEELLTIPLIKCPKSSSANREPYLAVANIVDLPRSGKLLVTDFYHESNKALHSRFFCDGKNALTCNKWPAISWGLRKPFGQYSYGYAYSDEHSDKLAREFLGKEFGRLENLVNNFVSDKRDEINHKNHDRKYGKMMEHFAMFPDYPRGLDRYCEQYVFDYSYIFISKIIKGKRDALCAYCRKRFKVDKSVRSGRYAECPKCGTYSKFCGEWTNYSKTDTAKICIVYSIDGQLLVRWTDVTRTFPGVTKACYKFDDYFYNLTLNTRSGQVMYSYKWQHNMGWGWQWFRKKNYTANYEETHVYADNLGEVFGEKHYGVDLANGLRGAGSLCFLQLLDNLKAMPITEYLFKLGLMRIASNIGVADMRGYTFSEALGVQNELKPLYRKYNPTWMEHLVAQTADSWISEEDFLTYRRFGFKYGRGDLAAIRDVLEYMGFARFIKYFTRQMEVTGQKILRLLGWYKDYINTSMELQVDLSRKSVMFPQNIKEAHDIVVHRFNQIKHEIEDNNMKHAAKKLYAGMKSYTNGIFCIVFPMGRSDLIKEGQSLNHCVGTEAYYNSHMEGTKMIFFVRKTENPERPYFTMEVDMKALTLKQLYGFGDSSATQEVRKFANEFINKLKPKKRSA